MDWTKSEKRDEFTEYACGNWRKITRPESTTYGVTIFNNKLIETPCCNGKTEKEAFEGLLRDIAAYRKKLDAVQAEIEFILAKMEENEKMPEKSLFLKCLQAMVNIENKLELLRNGKKSLIK